MSIIVSSGHRIAPQEQFAAWGAAWVRLLGSAPPTEIRLGGALGWDTLALRMADAYFAGAGERRPRMVVYCANRVTDLPTEAAQAVAAIGPELVELGLVDAGATWPEALMRRNVAMLVGGSVRDGRPVAGTPASLLALAWDGRDGGGTDFTRKEAIRRGIAVEGLGK